MSFIIIKEDFGVSVWKHPEFPEWGRSAQTAASGAGSASNNGTSKADRTVPLLERRRVLVVKLRFFFLKKALLIENNIKIFA